MMSVVRIAARSGRWRSLVAHCCLTVALLSVNVARASSQDVIAVTGGTLIDGTGRAPVPDAVLLIRDGRIHAVGPRASVQLPEGARRIDATGQYIIPGLMDANVHLILDASIEFMARYEGRFEELIEEAAQVALKHGLTTVFDSWGPLHPLMAVRDRIARGEAEGTRIFAAGNIIGFSGPFGRDFNVDAETVATRPFMERINALWEVGTGIELLYMTPEMVRDAVRAYIALGPDFIKYGASGHRDEDFLMFSPEAQRMMVEAAHEAGIIAQTHTTSVESLRQAIEAGNDMLQHCSVTGSVPIPPTTIELLLAKRVYCAVQPRTARRLEIELQMAAARTRSAQRKARLQVWHENEVALIAAGAPLLLATDAGLTQPDRLASMSEHQLQDSPTVLGNAHFLWFEAMAEKGMTPMEAIVSATRNIAAAYRMLDELGTLEAGKIADLVILDADPLRDVSNLRGIALVMKQGRIVDRAALPRRKVLTGGLPRVLLHTERGDIELEIDTVRAPVTGANFLRHVDAGVFQEGRFFRTVRADNQPSDSIRIAVVQAAAGQVVAARGLTPIMLEPTSRTGLRHRDGTISMARAAPHSATSSFFIAIGDQPQLDFGGRRNPDGLGFAAFGRVVRGMDVVRAIHAQAADEQQLLLSPVRIMNARRIGTGPHAHDRPDPHAAVRH